MIQLYRSSQGHFEDKGQGQIPDSAHKNDQKYHLWLPQIGSIHWNLIVFGTHIVHAEMHIILQY